MTFTVVLKKEMRKDFSNNLVFGKKIHNYIKKNKFTTGWLQLS